MEAGNSLSYSFLWARASDLAPVIAHQQAEAHSLLWNISLHTKILWFNPPNDF